MLDIVGGGVGVDTGMGDGTGLITIGSGEGDVGATRSASDSGSDSGSSGRRVVGTRAGEALELVGFDILPTREGTRDGGAINGVEGGTWLDWMPIKRPLSEVYCGMARGFL